jgi:hypothetical protein
MQTDSKVESGIVRWKNLPKVSIGILQNTQCAPKSRPPCTTSDWTCKSRAEVGASLVLLVKKLRPTFARNPCTSQLNRAAKSNEFGQVSIPLLRVNIADTKSFDEIERLLEEYEFLAGRQYEVLQKCPYAQLSRRETAAYDARFLRIQEISKEIVRLRSEAA